MASGRRGRSIGAIAVSAAVHALILAAVALHAPMLSEPEEPPGRPEAIIPVVLMPHTLPQTAAQKPTVVRLHHRPQRFAPPEIAPLPVPPMPTSRAARPGPVIVIHPAPLPEGPKGDIRATLRAGPPGCANPDAVGLTHEEREHCNEVFGKGAKTAPMLGLGIDPGKEGDFARAAAKKESERRYRETTPVPNGPPPAGPPNPTSAHDLARSMGNDKPDLTIPLPH
jgi:hypothetical protein